MDVLAEGLVQALRLLTSGDREVWAAVQVSVRVALASTLASTLLGLPLGYAVAMGRFRGRSTIGVILNVLMGIPTVVVGLLVYGFLSRRGLLGGMRLLYTPTAMVIGQTVLALPIVAALSRAVVAGLDPRAARTALSLGAGRIRTAVTVAQELGPALAAAVAAAFGRVFGEVGVSLMLGGNILFYTRNITTSIALETSKGEFAYGMALGIVLLAVSFAINLFIHVFKGRT